MTKELLIDMYYAAPELWSLIALCFVIVLTLLLFYWFKFMKLRHAKYFLNREKERFEESLFASKDGYFAFVYPDQKIEDAKNKEKEYCSRRLSILLSLPNGAKSKFEDVLKNFYKEDVKLLQKYVNLLKEDGVSFEEDFVIKNTTKSLRISGARINGEDGNLYSDIIWFRDISVEVLALNELENEKNS